MIISDQKVKEEEINWETAAYTWKSGENGPTISLQDNEGRKIELDFLVDFPMEKFQLFENLIQQQRGQRFGRG